ncbi:MAG: DNA (cytosine-5-)-methyltransferase [Sulfurimonas sp.]|jgi:DNA (cytosine-5)-methyltransferase 1|nr:DNA (cytosine-5-)-methyltransferase [Sulfurimonas sp.]HHU98141.1 DNA (cytosine-5-)-methyltransferase [Petrimonas sp.]
MKNKVLEVVELFAGVGGFRLGLEKNNYRVIWSNQWEPSTKTQHASIVYEARFGSENHSNEDITTVPTNNIPDCDVLCAGFPCQDYSVATTLNNSKGLKGKKGVLWWSIHRILEEKENKPKYLFLENVDRLLKSPVNQRGRDFAIMLQSLNKLGYIVEWRVINAAEYGMPQRRRRVFILGYHKSTKLYEQLYSKNKLTCLTKSGVFAKSFPVEVENTLSLPSFELKKDITVISNTFNINGKDSPFQNTGIMINGIVNTLKTMPYYKGKHTVLGDVLQNEEEVDSLFYISKEDQRRWEYLKDAKSYERISKDGHKYIYSEGGMNYPDALDKPSRTIITGEGGKSPSRFKHVIQTEKGLRRLTPVELERLNMFPDNHTKGEGITDSRRAFFMGNALVVGVVDRLSKELYNQIYKYEDSSI